MLGLPDWLKHLHVLLSHSKLQYMYLKKNVKGLSHIYKEEYTLVLYFLLQFVSTWHKINSEMQINLMWAVKSLFYSQKKSAFHGSQWTNAAHGNTHALLN